MKHPLLTSSIAAVLMLSAGTIGAQQPATLDQVRKNAATATLPPNDRLAVEALLTKLGKADISEEKRKEGIAEFLKTASPQVKQLFTGKPAAPAVTAGTGAAPAAGPKPGAPISFDNVPVPAPKAKGTAKEAKKKPPSPLTVDSNKLDFQQDDRVAIFTEDVKFRTATMDIDCEELKLLFKAGAFETGPAANGAAPPPPVPKGAKPAPSNPTPPAFDPRRPTQPDALTPPGEGAPEGPKKTQQEKVEKAWAKGNGTIVTIIRRSGTEITIAKCGEAVYEEKTGDLVLKINPFVQKGGKIVEASDRNTILILRGTGKLDVLGPVKTKSDASVDQNSKEAAPAPTPPASSTPPTNPPKAKIAPESKTNP